MTTPPVETIDRDELDRDEDNPALVEAIAKRRTRNRLTEHFVIEEFDCRDGTRVRRGRAQTYEYLCKVFLEPMRDKFGSCRVSSGYRTKRYNASIGGASQSLHVNEMHDADDVAADVSFARGTPRDWYREADRIRRSKRGGRGGLGLYVRSGFIHIDTRDYPANWTG